MAQLTREAKKSWKGQCQGSQRRESFKRSGESQIHPNFEKCKKFGKRTQCDLSTNHDNFTENSYTRVGGWKKTAIRAQQCASSVIRLNTTQVTEC